MIVSFGEGFVRATEPHAAWAMEQVEVFTGHLPSGPWTADLSACVYRQGGLDLRVGLLGSYDESDGSWLWAWADPGFAGTPVAAAAEVLRRFGEERGVPEFAEEPASLAGFGDPRTAVERLAFGAMGVLGAAGYVGVVAGPGSRAYLVSDDPAVPVAGPDPVTLPRVLLTAVGPVPEARPRAVVAGCFARHGLAARADGDGGLRADLADGSSVEVAFDGAGRITRVNVAAPGPRPA
ncbi:MULTISPECIES: DUF6882 domain-containing protein [Streptomyces]|uniref:Uncharacterized protein n=1 Tax=Streptomyces sudanensis TaxID=436397 RepID=A0ABY4TF79_9ACTN|nr:MULTISPECIES: DUF6882 domain-containing protein [Streptomyces]URN17392.1 hypothetical protein MW084_17305 [Streptomyces sudanensis]